MKIHRLITLSVSAMLHETGVTALDLHATSSLLLYMFNISALVAYHLCS